MWVCSFSNIDILNNPTEIIDATAHYIDIYGVKMSGHHRLTMTGLSHIRFIEMDIINQANNNQSDPDIIFDNQTNTQYFIDESDLLNCETYAMKLKQNYVITLWYLIQFLF